ncbi:MAG: hypothetical protein HY670_09365 [Chloroflexi bacterium]|nr:hypothetical protein [Chloroflexota bacterium]
MSILKAFGLAALNFLLFLALTVFGLVFLLNATVLNPRFITSQINKLEITPLVQEAMKGGPGQQEIPPELRTAIITTMTKIEPDMKQQMNAAITQVYDYLKGKQKELKLAAVLSDTVASNQFIVVLINDMEIAAMARGMLADGSQTNALPKELTDALLRTVTKMEPQLKTQLGAAASSVNDYIWGKQPDIKLAVVLSDTVASNDFLVALVNDLEIATLAKGFIASMGTQPQGGMPKEVTDALSTTITKLELQLKKQLATLVPPVNNYLWGKTQELHLVVLLGDTVLTRDFVTAVVNELDMKALARGFVNQQVTGFIPKEFAFATAYVDDVAVALEPWLKQQATAVAGPVLDYLAGKSQTLNVTISIEPAIAIAKPVIKQRFMTAPPPEFALLPRELLDQQFEQAFRLFAQAVPQTMAINESALSSFRTSLSQVDTQVARVRTDLNRSLANAEAQMKEARTELNLALSDAEKQLAEVKRYVGYFQMGYTLLIIFMLLLIAGIVLIHRQVRGATRTLGTTFASYGVLEFGGVMVGKSLAAAQLPQLTDVPASLQTWLAQFLNSFTAPFQGFTLGVLILGIALLVVSFVYKPRAAPEI